MAEIIITTDGTLTGTTLKVDGKDITKNNKVVSISMGANAPFKGAISGDIYKGGVYVAYEQMNDNGTVERKSFGTSDTNYIKGIGQKIKQNDQVVQYLGQVALTENVKLVDAIIKHCTDNKLQCPDRDKLLARTKESLMDKITDFGIKLEG
jgi:hypothetical protein